MNGAHSILFWDLYKVPMYGCLSTNSLLVVVAPFSASHRIYSGLSDKTTNAYKPGFK